jgi:hypothetical protein
MKDVGSGPDTLELMVRLELGSTFVLESELGRGPQSVTFRTREVGTGDLVSLKVIPQGVNGGVSVDAFSRALVAVRKLDHPRIVRVHRYGAAPQFLWYACPYVDGRSLAERLSVEGSLVWGTCLRLVEELADALEHAHRLGIAHGDLKPENVLVDGDGSCHVRDFQAAAWRADARCEAGVESEGGHEPDDISADRDAVAALVFACMSGASWASAEGLRGSPRGGLRDLASLMPQAPGYATAALERAFGWAPGAGFTSVRQFAAALRDGPASSALAGARVLFVKRDDLTVHPFQRGYRMTLGVLGLVSVAAMSATAWLAQPGAGPEAIPMTAPSRTSVPAPPQSQPAPADSPRVVSQVVAPRPHLRTRGRPATSPSGGVGFLSVSTMPWGQLYFDGVLLGDTPQLGLPVATGRHLVEVERRGFLSATREVQVAPGESVSVTDVELHRATP